MNARDTDQAQEQDTEQNGERPHGPDGPSDKSDEEYVEEAKKLSDVYKEDRPTVVLPGSDGTVTGTAVNDWVDDDGNAIDHGKDDSDSEGTSGGPGDEKAAKE